MPSCATPADRGVEDIRVHCFLDGRDVPPQSAGEYLRELLDVMAEPNLEGKVRISSVEGRYYAMDRDKRWERVERAWGAVVCGVPRSDENVLDSLEASYENGVTDEFFVPTSFDGRGMQDGDAAVFFNFRPDRARELTRAIVDAEFDGFDPRTASRGLFRVSHRIRSRY